MIRIIFTWILSAAVIFLVAAFVPGFRVENFYIALVVAAVLGIFNAFAKPAILLLTLPITVLTLGLFIFVINALLLLLTSAIVPGFTIDNFFSALAAALLLWLIHTIIDLVAK